jgi:hypothetical protein
MAATIPAISLIPVQPIFTESERLALAGYLAGYRGLTRDAYTLDLRQFTAWCRSRSLPLFSVRNLSTSMRHHRVSVTECWSLSPEAG